MRASQFHGTAASPWRGVIPVVTTTFTPDGSLDLLGYQNNLDRLVKAGVQGVITLATAGEVKSHCLV
jgi:4-hydroxy-tetrahydrodipicolinate synthase